MADIGKSLRLAMAENGDKSGDVAKRASVPPCTISLISKGKANPTFKILTRVAEAFNMPLSDFVKLGE